MNSMVTFVLYAHLFLLAQVCCHEVKLKNNCKQELVVNSLENGEGKQKETWNMGAGEETGKERPNKWEGRFWARYSDVGPIEGWPQPDSLAEIRFDGYAELDYYDVSLVDGFNIPVTIAPLADTIQKNDADEKSCKTIACSADLIGSCPEELKLKQDDRVVACQSACTKFHTEEFCCTDAHQTVETCPPTDKSRFFKDACPDAYSFAKDDASSTFTCKSAGGKSSGYLVTFC